MQSVTPGSIDFQTIPFVGTATDDQGRSIIQLADTNTLHTFFAGLSGGKGGSKDTGTAAATTVSPSKVSVEVYNGSGTAGLAGTSKTQLEAAGFHVTGTANADSSKYTTTEIRYAAGDEALAATLAAQLPGVKTTQSKDPKSGTVQLVLGKDFTAVGKAVIPPTAAASSTDAGARTAADTTCIN
jgi:hypothetical protein